MIKEKLLKLQALKDLNDPSANLRRAFVEIELKAVLDKLEYIKGEIGPMGPQGVQGPQGMTGTDGRDGRDGIKGATGDRGRDGYTPIRGVDYWTKTDIEAIKAEILKVLPKQKEVKVVDHQKLIDASIEKVRKDIPTNESVASVLLNHPVMRNLMHGGGNIVSAGTNVTITTGPNGEKVISSTGGSGTYSPQKATGIVVGTSITLPSTPLANTLVLNINGQIMLEGTDFTLTGANITGLPAWTTGNNYQANYAI